MTRVLPLVTAMATMAAVITVSRCGGSTPASPSPGPGPSGPPAVLVGAGDIGLCGSPAVAETAQLLDRIPGIVFTAGDNAYPSGTAANFRDCYGRPPATTTTSLPGLHRTSPTSGATPARPGLAITATWPGPGSSSPSTLRCSLAWGRLSSSGCAPSSRPAALDARWPIGTSHFSRPARMALTPTCERSGGRCTTSTSIS